MQISSQDLLELIINPTLQILECHKATAARNLLLAIADQRLKPNKLSPGLGIYHIDAATHQQVWDKYLAFRPELASKIRGLASQHAFLSNPHLELSTNLQYATAIAWILYVLHPQELRSGLMKAIA
jgi:hypothetical protein